MEKFINQCLKGEIIQKNTNIVSNKTKITVYMLIYNGEKYLYYSLPSILNQNFSNYEFIAVDDKSEDNTLQILQNYKFSNKIISTENSSKPLFFTALMHIFLNIIKQ